MPLIVLLSLLAFALADPSWTRLSTKNNYAGRGETAFARCGDQKLCLLGGRGANRVSILDTASLTWTEGASNSLEMNHFQAAYGPDDCVWVAGAWTGGFPTEETVNDVWTYCRASDEWEKRASIPRPRGAGGAVFYDGKLYLVSGNVGGHNADAKVVPWFDCYDPSTDEWSELPDVPNPRDHFHATVVGSKLYVAAGRFSTSDLPDFFSDVATEVDVYDFQTSKWSSLPDFPRPRAGVAAVVFDSSVMILGGESERRSAWTEVDVLRGDTFVPGDEMLDPRHGFGAVSCNGAVWVAGGAGMQGGGVFSDETYAYFDADQPPACKDAPDDEDPSPSESSSSPASSSPASSSGGGETKPTSASSSGGVETKPTSDARPSKPAGNDDNAGAGDSNASGSEENTNDGNEPTSEAPTSSTTPTSSEPDSDPVCFPSNAMLQLQDGSTKRMDQLRIGDRVKVAHPNEYSEVFFFSHRDEEALSKLITISTSRDDISLTLSRGHMLYVNGLLDIAANVRVGDEVSVNHHVSSSATVTRLSVEIARGLHNPHTFHGDIIVNRVVASTYTSALPTTVSRMLLLPFKLMYRTLGASYHLERANEAVLRVLEKTYWQE